MEKVREFLINKKLCDNNFLLCINNYLEFISPKLIDFAGCYQIENQIKAKVPRIIDDYTRSVVIHELGHLYDYYQTGMIIENEDTSLLWELLYLRCSDNEELLSNRINKINQDTSSTYYKSLQKIKKRS